MDHSSCQWFISMRYENNNVQVHVREKAYAPPPPPPIQKLFLHIAMTDVAHPMSVGSIEGVVKTDQPDEITHRSCHWGSLTGQSHL